MYLRSYEENMECSDTVFAVRDPLNIPEVRNFIDKAASKKKKRRLQTPKGKKALSFLSLPLDLILAILDCLEYYKDIKNTLQVFPQWDSLIPNTYWRSRFPRDIIFEYEEITHRHGL